MVEGAFIGRVGRVIEVAETEVRPQLYHEDTRTFVNAPGAHECRDPSSTQQRDGMLVEMDVPRMA